MGIATVQERESQLGAYVRERETLERQIGEAEREAAEARERGDEKNAEWFGQRAGDHRRTLKIVDEQIRSLSEGAKVGRGVRRAR